MSDIEHTQKPKPLDRPFFRKSDFLLVALILALACALFVAKLSTRRARGNQDLVAEIYQENQLLARVPLEGLAAGSYHLADFPQEDAESQALSKFVQGPADPSPNQTETGTGQGDYSIQYYVFEADGQGGLKVGEAPCPDRLCERGGYLHQVGDLSICVPGQLLVKLVAANDPLAEADLDIVIGQGKKAPEPQSP